MRKLLQVINRIERLDFTVMRLMRNRLNNLTKPPGSLGLLEEVAVRIAGITGREHSNVERRVIFVMCGDHGIA